MVERRSSNVEGCQIMAGLIERAQVITFTKSRVSAELVYRYAREQLERGEQRRQRRTRALPGEDPAAALPLSDRIRPYRGGYLRERAPSSARCSAASCAAW